MKRISSDRGSALVITLLLLIVLTAIGIYAVGTSSTEMDISLQVKTGTTAFYAAESGIYNGFVQIGPSLTTTTFSFSGTLPNQATYAGTGAMTVTTTAPGYGSTYMMTNYQLDSTGTQSSSVQRRVRAVVQYGPMPVGTMY